MLCVVIMSGVVLEAEDCTAVKRLWQMHPLGRMGWSRPVDSADDGGGIRGVSMCS